MAFMEFEESFQESVDKLTESMLENTFGPVEAYQVLRFMLHILEKNENVQEFIQRTDYSHN